MKPSRWVPLLRNLWAEGPRSIRDRLLDRWAERRRAHTFRKTSPRDDTLGIRAPVLIFLGTAPSPRLGGVQAQLLARLEAMDRLGKPYALLYPDGPETFRLEVATSKRRRFTRIAGPVTSSPPAIDDAELERILLLALELCGASVLHVEHLGALAAGSLVALAGTGHKIVLALHDFLLFCPRPHLLERPQTRFCHYCQDLARCTSCLRVDWPVPASFQGDRRKRAAKVLQAVDAVVFPSYFLQRAFQGLFPELRGIHSSIVEPPGRAGAPPGPYLHRSRPELNVAFVGGARPHKGSDVFEALLRGLGADEQQAFRWIVFGGGDPDILHRLRRQPRVTVRGYYRWGTLPRLLERERIDVVLILSIVPESYSLALTEALRAQVPVVAFDLGALGERIRRHGGGILVAPDEGWEGVRRALLSLLRQGKTVVRPVRREALGTCGRDAVRALESLYRELTAG